MCDACWALDGESRRKVSVDVEATIIWVWLGAFDGLRNWVGKIDTVWSSVSETEENLEVKEESSSLGVEEDGGSCMMYGLRRHRMTRRDDDGASGLPDVDRRFRRMGSSTDSRPLRHLMALVL